MAWPDREEDTRRLISYAAGCDMPQRSAAAKPIETN
jgi:hypothetical protein